MIAYHFPPLAGSSGVQRTMRFAQSLPEFGWEPLVLTAHPRAYEQVAADLEREIDPTLVVHRAQAWDSARHFAVRGRYLRSLACPDRWVSWKFDAVRTGMAMIRQLRPAALWSTFPIATAHVIGAELARRSGLPWIADFRDPMAQEGYPSDPRVHRAYVGIEQTTAARAAAWTFTSPSAMRTYAGRYPHAASRMQVIENGYDERSFARVDENARSPLNEGAYTLLHSGIVYPSERDPTQLFAALGLLRERSPRCCNACGCAFAARFTRTCCADWRRNKGSASGWKSCRRSPIATRWKKWCVPTPCSCCRRPTAMSRSRPSFTNTCAAADPSSALPTRTATRPRRWQAPA